MHHRHLADGGAAVRGDGGAAGRLAEDVSVKVFVTPTCQYCPAMMRPPSRWRWSREHVSAETIEVNEFPELADRYKVQAVPLTVINDSVAIPGMAQEQDRSSKQLMKAGQDRSRRTADASPDRARQRAPERPLHPVAHNRSTASPPCQHKSASSHVQSRMAIERRVSKDSGNAGRHPRQTPAPGRQAPLPRYDRRHRLRPLRLPRR